MVNRKYKIDTKNQAVLRRYLDDINDIPVLTRAEETTLIPAAQAGDQKAAQKVIEANLRFVVSIANQFRNRKLPLPDLISEGNLGLIRALSTFDSTRGIKFITYAKWWVRQSILYALIRKTHVVRLPQNKLRDLRKKRMVLENLEQKLHRAPLDHEIADAMGQNIDTMWMSTFLTESTSLDAPIEPDEQDPLKAMLPNHNVEQPDHELDLESLKLDLRFAMDILNEREVEIIRLMFGLDGGRPANLGQLAKRYNVSRERIRQIKNRALEKLRESHKIVEALRDYLD